MKKRLFSLLVVGLMILSLVGCTAPSNATASSQGSASATAPSAAPADAAASQTAAPENVKPASAKDDAQPYYISMLLQTFATEPASDENRALSYIEEYTNTDLDITWKVSNDYDTMIDVLVASGDVPMVLTVRDQKDSVIVQAVKSGFFWDITDYLDDTENFPNLSSYNRDVAAQVRYDGRLYSLYNAADLSRSGWHYRKDWAENLNLTIPETIDDIYEWARAFTEDDPDQNGKNDTFGLIMAADKAVKLEFHQMVINYGGGNEWVEDENGDLIPTFMTQPYIDAMDFFRKCYENGYMNQDYPSAAKSTIYQYWQAGQGGLFYMSLNDAFGKNVTAIYDAIPGATNDVFNLIQSVDGSYRNYPTAGWKAMVMFPKNAVAANEDLEKILTFYDTMMSQEMQEFTTYGFEGEHWQLGADGYAELLDEEGKSNLFADISFNLNYVDNKRPAHYSEIREKVIKMIADAEPYAVICGNNPYLSDTYTEIGASLDQAVFDARDKYIVGAIGLEEFQTAVDNWYQDGGQQIIAEYSQQHRAAAAAAGN